MSDKPTKNEQSGPSKDAYFIAVLIAVATFALSAKINRIQPCVVLANMDTPAIPIEMQPTPVIIMGDPVIIQRDGVWMLSEVKE